MSQISMVMNRRKCEGCLSECKPEFRRLYGRDGKGFCGHFPFTQLNLAGFVFGGGLLGGTCLLFLSTKSGLTVPDSGSQRSHGYALFRSALAPVAQ